MLENLKLLRTEKRISQQKVAEFLDTSQQSINKYENHNIEPDINTLKRLADFFDTSVDYLIGYTEIRHKIEPIKDYQLNENEADMLEKYRRLPSDFKETINSLFDDLLSKL